MNTEPEGTEYGMTFVQGEQSTANYWNLRNTNSTFIGSVQFILDFG